MKIRFYSLLFHGSISFWLGYITANTSPILFCGQNPFRSVSVPRLNTEKKTRRK